MQITISEKHSLILIRISVVNMTVSLKELKKLPPLSSSARDVLQLIHDDDADISHFSLIIERDPALLSRIIGLANSAFFGARKVTDVQRAIIDVLGFRTAKNIVLGVVLGGIFNPKLCRTFELPKYWFMSLVTATLARDIVLGLKISRLDANDAYLSGMLNEIGLMALAYLYPAEMDHVLADDEQSIYLSESELFGRNHYDISADFLHEWHLPDVVTDVMLESSPNSEKKCGDLCQIISLSHNLSGMIYDKKSIDLNELTIPTCFLEDNNNKVHLLELIVEEANEKMDTYREMAELLS